MGLLTDGAAWCRQVWNEIHSFDVFFSLFFKTEFFAKQSNYQV
jgi:hypothetical protein